jgi:hypothetical protein
MAAKNVINTILKTINEVQKQNKSNKQEETADRSVFDLLKGKLQDLDQKTREKRAAKGKSPVGILDMIRKEIEGVKRENKKDPNVKTAPRAVFDKILKKVEEPKRRMASSGVKKIVEDYNLDISSIPRDVLSQVQQQYLKDKAVFDKQYAKALFDLTKKFK